MKNQEKCVQAIDIEEWLMQYLVADTATIFVVGSWTPKGGGTFNSV